MQACHFWRNVFLYHPQQNLSYEKQNLVFIADVHRTKENETFSDTIFAPLRLLWRDPECLGNECFVVWVRLLPSEITYMAAILAAIVFLWEQYNNSIWGWERVFPLLGFARVDESASKSKKIVPPVLCCIADMHWIVLSIARLAVSFAVGENPSSNLLIVAKCNWYFEVGCCS